MLKEEIKLNNKGYKEIATNIENKILKNFINRGDKLPSERDLSDEYMVSRTTIRRAIDFLITKGLLVRKPGSGTYVKNNNIFLNVEEQISFSEKMEGLNNNHETKIIDFKIIDSTSRLKELFNFEKNEKFIFAKRIRYIDSVAVNLEKTYMPYEMFPELSEDILKKSKYFFIEKTKKLSIKESHNILIPILPNQEVQNLFNIRKNTPIFMKKSKGILTSEKIFEYSELYYNPKYYEFFYKSFRI